MRYILKLIHLLRGEHQQCLCLQLNWKTLCCYSEVSKAGNWWGWGGFSISPSSSHTVFKPTWNTRSASKSILGVRPQTIAPSEHKNVSIISFLSFINLTLPDEIFSLKMLGSLLSLKLELTVPSSHSLLHCPRHQQPGHSSMPLEPSQHYIEILILCGRHFEVPKSIPQLIRHNNQILFGRVLFPVFVTWLSPDTASAFLPCALRRLLPTPQGWSQVPFSTWCFFPRYLNNTYKLRDHTADSVSSVPPTLPKLPSKKLVSKCLPHIIKSSW